MKKKKAFITGISGQDGAYLANFLLNKGYTVVGGERQNASGSAWRLKELGIEKNIKVIPFELLEENNIVDVIRLGKYDEIYNLAAQSFVGNSYSSPVFTSNVNALGVLRILEAIRHFSKKTKFYQASTSEMYGNAESNRQNEETSFEPISPYAISKLYAHWMVNLYREAYDIFCCAGILFNHESPLRGGEFVTKKIITDLARVKYENLPNLSLGNIYSKRDWGYSEDYVEAMWKMLQQKKAEDFVISSGKTYTVKDFINKAAKYYGFNLIWKGTGLSEKALDKKTKKVIVRIDKKYFRPTEVNYLYGDSSKAKKNLKWSPKTNIDQLIKKMCDHEIKKYK
tara:strand:- start:1699 stop:2718 length:1020 start_codon:yes stop_codon:yes gene_type:complete